jgi:hypothetical protein
MERYRESKVSQRKETNLKVQSHIQHTFYITRSILGLAITTETTRNCAIPFIPVFARVSCIPRHVMDMRVCI